MSRPRGKAADPSHFVVYIDAAGGHRWRLVARNGRTVADSGEAYARLQGAVDGAQRVRDFLRANDVPVQVDLRKPAEKTVSVTTLGDATEVRVPA